MEVILPLILAAVLSPTPAPGATPAAVAAPSSPSASAVPPRAAVKGPGQPAGPTIDVSTFAGVRTGLQLGSVWRVRAITADAESVHIECTSGAGGTVRFYVSTTGSRKGPFDVGEVHIGYGQSDAPFSSFEEAGKVLSRALVAGAGSTKELYDAVVLQTKAAGERSAQAGRAPAPAAAAGSSGKADPYLSSLVGRWDLATQVQGPEGAWEPVGTCDRRLLQDLGVVEELCEVGLKDERRPSRGFWGREPGGTSVWWTSVDGRSGGVCVGRGETPGAGASLVLPLSCFGPGGETRKERVVMTFTSPTRMTIEQFRTLGGVEKRVVNGVAERR